MNDLLKELNELKKKIAILEEKIEKEDSKAWKPENGKNYWYIGYAGETLGTLWTNHKIDQLVYDVGNCFPTEERTEQVAEKFKMLLKLERYHDMFCPDFVPDWDNASEKYYVYYLAHSNRWDYDVTFSNMDAVQVYFDSEETVAKVCDLLNQEESE